LPCKTSRLRYHERHLTTPSPGHVPAESRLAHRASRHLKEKIIESGAFPGGAGLGVHDAGHRLHPGVRVGGVLQPRADVDFLTDTQWTPLFDDAHFGIVVLLSGTLVSSGVALLVAIPLGTIIAIYLSEFAGPRMRETAKPMLELLSGVPTIVYGYFALLFVTPLLQRIHPELPGFNLLSAGLVMGIMIIPTVSSIAEDAMRAVPMNLREGSYAMGATRCRRPLASSCRRPSPASWRPTSSASRARWARP
jgi:phosphate transport system permease protein